MKVVGSEMREIKTKTKAVTAIHRVLEREGRRTRGWANVQPRGKATEGG